MTPWMVLEGDVALNADGHPIYSALDGSQHKLEHSLMAGQPDQAPKNGSSACGEVVSILLLGLSEGEIEVFARASFEDDRKLMDKLRRDAERRRSKTYADAVKGEELSFAAGLLPNTAEQCKRLRATWTWQSNKGMHVDLYCDDDLPEETMQAMSKEALDTDRAGRLWKLVFAAALNFLVGHVCMTVIYAVVEATREIGIMAPPSSADRTFFTVWSTQEPIAARAAGRLAKTAYNYVSLQQRHKWLMAGYTCFVYILPSSVFDLARAYGSSWREDEAIRWGQQQADRLITALRVSGIKVSFAADGYRLKLMETRGCFILVSWDAHLHIRAEEVCRSMLGNAGFAARREGSVELGPLVLPPSAGRCEPGVYLTRSFVERITLPSRQLRMPGRGRRRPEVELRRCMTERLQQFKQGMIQGAVYDPCHVLSELGFCVDAIARPDMQWLLRLAQRWINGGGRLLSHTLVHRIAKFLFARETAPGAYLPSKDMQPGQVQSVDVGGTAVRVALVREADVLGTDDAGEEFVQPLREGLLPPLGEGHERFFHGTLEEHAIGICLTGARVSIDDPDPHDFGQCFYTTQGWRTAVRFALDCGPRAERRAAVLVFDLDSGALEPAPLLDLRERERQDEWRAVVRYELGRRLANVTPASDLLERRLSARRVAGPLSENRELVLADDLLNRTVEPEPDHHWDHQHAFCPPNGLLIVPMLSPGHNDSRVVGVYMIVLQ